MKTETEVLDLTRKSPKLLLELSVTLNLFPATNPWGPLQLNVDIFVVELNDDDVISTDFPTGITRWFAKMLGSPVVLEIPILLVSGTLAIR